MANFTNYNDWLDFEKKRYSSDCGDNSCRYAENKGGVRTNGGCRCDECPYCGQFVRPSSLDPLVMREHRSWCTAKSWRRGTEIRTFFTSDLHFNHVNIIQYCNRPWTTVHEMNQGLINNWNNVVGENDKVVVLGDFGMGKKELWCTFCSQLNGFKIIILGNHDKDMNFMYSVGFNSVIEKEFDYIDYSTGKHYLLSHEPKAFSKDGKECLDPDFKYKNVINLHGHVHERYKFRENHINVGVDVWDYTPRTLEELLAGYNEWLATKISI